MVGAKLINPLGKLARFVAAKVTDLDKTGRDVELLELTNFSVCRQLKSYMKEKEIMGERVHDETGGLPNV